MVRPVTIQRAFASLFSDDLSKSRDFYVSLFGWRIDFDSDWFVHLQAPDNPAVELGIMKRDHALVPAAFRNAPSGTMITVVVDDVDAKHDLAKQQGLEIVQAPKNEFYGQRRMLLRDPDGTLVDVSSECPPDPEFLASLST